MFQLCPPLQGYANEFLPQSFVNHRVLGTLIARAFKSVDKLPQGEFEKGCDVLRLTDGCGVSNILGDSYSYNDAKGVLKKINYFFFKADDSKPKICMRHEDVGFNVYETSGFIVPSEDDLELARQGKNAGHVVKFLRETVLDRSDEPNWRAAGKFQTHIACDKAFNCNGWNTKLDKYTSQQIGETLNEKLCITQGTGGSPVCEEIQSSEGEPQLLDKFLGIGHGYQKTWKQYFVAGAMGLMAASAFYQTCKAMKKIWDIHYTGAEGNLKKEAVCAAGWLTASIALATLGVKSYSNITFNALL